LQWQTKNFAILFKYICKQQEIFINAKVNNSTKTPLFDNNYFHL